MNDLYAMMAHGARYGADLPWTLEDVARVAVEEADLNETDHEVLTVLCLARAARHTNYHYRMLAKLLGQFGKDFGMNLESIATQADLTILYQTRGIY